MDSVDIVHGLNGHCPWTEWMLSVDIVHGLSGHCPWTQWTLSMDPCSNTPARQCPLSPRTFFRCEVSLNFQYGLKPSLTTTEIIWGTL